MIRHHRILALVAMAFLALSTLTCKLPQVSLSRQSPLVRTIPATPTRVPTFTATLVVATRPVAPESSWVTSTHAPGFAAMPAVTPQSGTAESTTATPPSQPAPAANPLQLPHNGVFLEINGQWVELQTGYDKAPEPSVSTSETLPKLVVWLPNADPKLFYLGPLNSETQEVSVTAKEGGVYEVVPVDRLTPGFGYCLIKGRASKSETNLFWSFKVVD